ncbi:MAG: HlyD family efflux transporter periplasmic adaptor subunit [Desulfobulbaceae bacterium]|nr:HlyD family efflux transporter periplasmic adaptor subunit [Desulfobulbaceae bacterium]
MLKIFTKYKSLVIGSAVIIAAALVAGRLFIQSGTLSGVEAEVIAVERKDFSVHTVDRGVVRPARIAPVSSMISSNQAKIVWLAQEGTKVAKGTLVAKFDTKPFMDSLHKAEQLYADAKASYLAAEKVLDLQKEEEDGKIEEAVRKVEIDEIKGNNIKNGSGPLKRKVLVQKLNQARRTFEISQDELDDMKLLLEKGHVSSREKDKAKDKVITAREQMAVAQAEIDNFDSYVWPQMLRESELLVNAATSALARVKRTAELVIQNRVAEVEKNRRKQENKGVAFNRAKQDIANCNVFSPAEGILLYSELPRDNKRRKVQIGDSVWVGQTFLEVPDTTELIAEIQVREVDVAKIKVGMTVEIEVDAFPGKSFEGQVSSIASLAKEDEANTNIRRFPTRVSFIGNSENVHVGMSVTTKIIHNSVKDALVVPISALSYQDGMSVVYKVEGESKDKIPVNTGERGQQLVEIKSGLAVGDLILKEAL